MVRTMSKGNDLLTLQNYVASETPCYVTQAQGLRHTLCVLVPAGSSVSDVYHTAHENDMVCTGTNVLRAESFDVELTFKHITQTKLMRENDA